MIYYFKVPVFTKLSRIQNIIILIFQTIIIIISILISLYRGCSYESIEFIDGCDKFNILPGNIMITNTSYSLWQYLKPKKYSSELITDIYDIKYYNIMNTKLNDYILLKGDIVIFDKNNKDYYANFKEYINQIYYHNFISDFKENVDMNKEIYNIDIKNGLLELMFLNNCSNNSVLLENNKSCIFKNNTYNNINYFLNSYFNEIFIVPFSCHNCYKNGIHTLDELITVLSKCISIFFMLNSFLIIIYLFIISKIKDSDIGYINDVVNIDMKKNNEIELNYINELIKN